MLVTGLGELLAGARTDVTERIGVLGTTLEQLSRQGRDPRTVARYYYRRCDDVHIALRKSRRY